MDKIKALNQMEVELHGQAVIQYLSALKATISTNCHVIAGLFTPDARSVVLMCRILDPAVAAHPTQSSKVSSLSGLRRETSKSL